MFTMFQHRPWNAMRYARRWAELQAAVHAIKDLTELASQRQIFATNIQNARALSNDARAKTLRALEAMPESDRLCHGDFWPGNILMTRQGEIIIDWIHASCGNPLADLARTTNLVLGFTKTHQIRRPFLSYSASLITPLKNSLLQIFCHFFYPVYLEYYFKLCPGDRQEYRRWLPIVAAARLADNIPELKKLLLAEVEMNL